jgi:small-conductance mechanosensitive channel
VDKVRKIVKHINKEFQKNAEFAPRLLGKIKSQGVRQLEDSAMIMRVKFKSIPGEQFVMRRELLRRLQEEFHTAGIQFAHRNVTVYMPPSAGGNNAAARDAALQAGAAAAALQAQEQEEAAAQKKPA